MTFKLFHWLAATVRRSASVADTLLRVRHARRPRLERTHEPFDASAHALRGCYLGLLAGLGGTNR
jgi:hypothetical protein